VGVLVPGAAEARFDVTEDTDGNPLAFTRLTQIWTSPPTRCDVTLLRFEGPEPRLPGRFEPAGVLPPVTPGAYVTVVGHPGGGGLKLSIRGNDLIAYDTEQVKAHYKAPTEPGSSGSPVFNKDWQLIAVHHAGSDRLPRVDGITGFYEANEGITLPAIRAEYAATR
jgi:hypothetical protein